MKARKKKYYKEGGKVAPMEKKKAGMTHSDGARRVPNYKKGASNVKKEFKTAYDREQHRLGKAGSQKLAQELKNGGKIKKKGDPKKAAAGGAAALAGAAAGAAAAQAVKKGRKKAFTKVKEPRK